MNTKQICQTGVFLGLVFVVTRFIQVPIPLGYFNIGNTVILLACLFLPVSGGVIAGSVGSALADLTSYPVYTLPTLIIKALMPLVFYLLAKKFHQHAGSEQTALQLLGKHSNLIAFAIATLIPLFGYTITGGIIYGGFYQGLAQFPGLLLEYAANLILYAIAEPAVRKIKVLATS